MSIIRRTSLLKNLFNSKNLEFIMEAHNGMSAKIVEETGFKAIWASGLTMSASMGLRDNNEASWCQVLNNLEYMADATKIPILVDGDSGYGDFNNARRYVRKLEERGLAGVCFEDKLFPKTNSFINGESQQLANIGEFCAKISACKDYQKDPDFCVVARLESFITGQGLEDALRRAHYYVQSGADAILVHSKKSTPVEIVNFSKCWDSPVPLIIVPTKYWRTPVQEFRDANISTVIWANHNMRSVIKSLKETSENIYKNESLFEIEKNIEPVEEIFRLQNAMELTEDDNKYNKFTTNIYNVFNKTNNSFLKKIEKNEDYDGQPARLRRAIDRYKYKSYMRSHLKTKDNLKGQRKYHTSNVFTETERDFLSCRDFYNELKHNGIDFYTGVPDSLLKDYLSYISCKNNFVTANEGLSVSLAAGYHLATKKIPCVYLQNSGIGNIINPLLSLVNKNVYNIPMLFLIGWRGEPYKKDEPQHKIQGQITENILNALNIKYSVLPDNMEYASFKISEQIKYIKNTNNPAAFLVKRQTFFNESKNIEKKINNRKLTRFEALETITKYLSDYKFISTTGFTSRELLSIREKNDHSKCQDFYVVGSMGHCSSIATGYSLFSNNKTVCIDGDGSLLMHMGTLSTIGNNQPNIIHILLNNNMHESVGGQSTNNYETNFNEIANACNYKHTFLVHTKEELKKILKNKNLFGNGPVFIEVKIKNGTIDNLPRPKNNLLDLKHNFINM